MQALQQMCMKYWCTGALCSTVSEPWDLWAAGCALHTECSQRADLAPEGRTSPACKPAPMDCDVLLRLHIKYKVLLSSFAQM